MLYIQNTCSRNQALYCTTRSVNLPYAISDVIDKNHYLHSEKKVKVTVSRLIIHVVPYDQGLR